MTSRRYLQLVRASAWYDLVVTAPFATPWTFQWLHAALCQAAGIVGAGALPAFDPTHILFANLLGSVVVVWSLLRILGARVSHGLFDAAARALFACWQAYALAHGASLVILPFLAFEVFWGVAQLAPWVGKGPVRAAAAS